MAKWYRLSAFQGNGYAQFKLGWMHEKGLGVEQSDIEAARWYMKSARRGNRLASIRLDWMLKR